MAEKTLEYYKSDEYAYSAENRRRMEKKAKELGPPSEWYSLRSILGYDWAMFYFLLGGREAGKSYATTDFFCRQWRKYGRPFYWLRLTEASQKKLLANNAEKLIDPDLRRKYNLDLFTRGDAVYEVIKRDAKGKIVEKKQMARVMALNTFYNDKGSGLFDKDFLNDPKMYYNICLDEMNREANEKNSFDIVYAFANQLENLVRSTKQRLRIICIGNTLQEASDILCSFDFLPNTFGRYKLRKKRAVIDYIKPTEVYKKRREGTVADILAGDSSTFTNEVEIDATLIDKTRLITPHQIIKFSKQRGDWYVVWSSQKGNTVISPYKGETVNNIVAMRPYLDEVFNEQLKNAVIARFNANAYHFDTLMCQKKFKRILSILKKG